MLSGEQQQTMWEMKPYHVTITRGQKGGVGVEISVRHEDPDQAVAIAHIAYVNECKKLGIDPKPVEGV